MIYGEEKILQVYNQANMIAKKDQKPRRMKTLKRNLVRHILNRAILASPLA
jgi:hypothetical protein